MTNLTRIVRGAGRLHREPDHGRRDDLVLPAAGSVVEDARAGTRPRRHPGPAGQQLGRLVGRDLDDAAAERAGVALHRTFGPTYGVIASVLAGRGMPPLRAGPTIAAVAWAVVDEGTALPLMTSYPLLSRARGVVGHATLGLTIGVLLALLDQPA
jgi:hypothetical protein